ncbi:MAG: efflux RND transporter permease subunit [Acidobacteria bacterium]|nr:efflux RND transporter permease subunit [Acidobacteriota bacterium]
MVKFALRNPHAVAVMALGTIVIGLTVLTRVPTDILPTFRTPAVQILTFYPGMPAEFVEQDISTRLERWTGQANGVARQESKSMIGVSVVKDFFRPDIDPNTALSMVSSLAMSDLYYLPPGTIPPMVMPFDPTATIPLALVTVSSATADEARLYDVAYFELRNRLQSITGVIAPAVYGGKLRRILAYVDRDRLQARNLDPLDVINAMRASNVLVPTGSAKLGDLEYQVNANAMVERVPDFNGIPIKVDGGAPIFVRDVATVKDAAQIQTNVVRIDGRRQVYIPIYRQPGANTIAVVDGIKQQLGAIKARLPQDVNLDVVMDQSVYVRKSIEQLEREGVLGAMLAALMILVFLGSVRSMAMILISLPLAIIAAIIGLFALDQSLNSMTLGGLALAVGLLIDQSIVVIENVERHLREDGNSFRAALEGTSEVAGPVLIITITIMAVFFPVLFLTGMGKFLFAPLALAVSLALAGSYLIAMTLVPVLCWKLLKGHAAPDSVATESLSGNTARPGVFERSFARVRDAYGHALDRALAYRWLLLGAVVVAFGVSLALYAVIGQELFPQVDAGQITLRVRGPSGLRIERTEALVADVERTLRDVIPPREIVKLVSNVGVLLDWPAAYTPNSGPMDAFINVQLADAREHGSQRYAERLRARLNTRFPDVEFATDTGGMITAALNFGLASPIDIQIEGRQLPIAAALAEQVRQRVARVAGAADVRIQQRQDYPQIKVDVDRVKEGYLGVTNDAVVKNIVTALNSSINFAPSFWFDAANGNHYFLGAQYSEDAIEDLETLKNIPISSPGTNTTSLLRNLAQFSRTTAPAEVSHLNITRVVDVYANVSGRDIGSVARDVERAIADLRRPAGYTIQMRGEVAIMRESFANMGFGLALAAALVYLIMVVQFRSFVEPLVIIAAVPLGLIGVLWMLWLTGTTLNIQSLMGIIMMIGIAVSYSILYVDFANRRVAEGATPDTAIRVAGRIRLRPILMTSLAAILALLPMALTSAQATTPLARAVIGGVGTSMLLTLFVVPALYVAVKRTPRPPSPENPHGV